MLEIIRSEQGEILGACEYNIVSDKGVVDDKGLYIWIANCEVSKSAEHTGILSKFVKLITDLHPFVEFGYFWRKTKYPDRSPRIYSKQVWLSLLNNAETYKGGF